MPVESDADLATFFNADEFGVAATYTPPGGGPAVPCTVLLNSAGLNAEAGQSRPLAGQRALTVQQAEVASPARGGTFAIAGTNYEVMDRPRATDPDRKLWSMWVIAS